MFEYCIRIGDRNSFVSLFYKLAVFFHTSLGIEGVFLHKIIQLADLVFSLFFDSVPVLCSFYFDRFKILCTIFLSNPEHSSTRIFTTKKILCRSTFSSPILLHVVVVCVYHVRCECLTGVLVQINLCWVSVWKISISKYNNIFNKLLLCSIVYLVIITYLESKLTCVVSLLQLRK